MKDTQRKVEVVGGPCCGEDRYIPKTMTVGTMYGVRVLLNEKRFLLLYRVEQSRANVGAIGACLLRLPQMAQVRNALDYGSRARSASLRRMRMLAGYDESALVAARVGAAIIAAAESRRKNPMDEIQETRQWLEAMARVVESIARMSAVLGELANALEESGKIARAFEAEVESIDNVIDSTNGDGNSAVPRGSR